MKLAWTLQLAHADELLPKLAPYGLDWEATEFARGDVLPYLDRRGDAIARFERLRAILEPWTGAPAKTEKRAYVDRVRAFLVGYHDLPPELAFTVAMRLYDAGADDALLVVDAHVLDEAPASLRAWRRAPDAEIRSILTAPVREEDG